MEECNVSNSVVDTNCIRCFDKIVVKEDMLLNVRFKETHLQKSALRQQKNLATIFNIIPNNDP